MAGAFDFTFTLASDQKLDHTPPQESAVPNQAFGGQRPSLLICLCGKEVYMSTLCPLSRKSDPFLMCYAIRGVTTEHISGCAKCHS